MKTPLKFLVAVVVILVLVAAGFFMVPRVLYVLPPFQSWVAGQIDEQSAGKFSFDSIQGDAFEARLAGAWLNMESGKSNVFQAKFDDLKATFALLPVAMLQLDLKELEATGGEVVLKLQGGDYERIRMPVSAEKLILNQGRLVIQNLHGYECVLESCDLTVITTEKGKKGNFTAATGKVGVVDLSEIKGTFEFSDNGLTVSDFAAIIPGQSDLKVQGRLNLNEAGMPIADASLSVDVKDVEALLSSLGYSDRFGGVAQVQTTFAGMFRPEAKKLNGAGTATLTAISAVVDLPKYPGIDDAGILNELKKITGLNGEATFSLAGDRVAVDPIQLKNDKMEVSGTLNVGYDKTVRGDQTLLASPALAAGIPPVASNIFKKNSTGQTVIPFSFKGTSNRPGVDTGSVVMKALLNPVKSAGGILGGLFGGGDKSKDKAEKK